MKLTKQQAKSVAPGQVLVINCDNAAELESTYRTAMKARKESPERVMAVSRSLINMTVTIYGTDPMKGGQSHG